METEQENKVLKYMGLESYKGLCENPKDNPDDEVFRLKSGVNTQF